MSFYEGVDRPASRLSEAHLVAASLIEHNEWHTQLPHAEHVRKNSSHPDVIALHKSTAREFVEHAIRGIRVGAMPVKNYRSQAVGESVRSEHESSTGRPLTPRQLAEFVRHRDNLAGFESYLNELTLRFDSSQPDDQIRIAAELERISEKLVHLHNLCEIVRHKTIREHADRPHHHKRIHALHDEIAGNIRELHGRVRARVTDNCGDPMLPSFEEAYHRVFTPDHAWQLTPEETRMYHASHAQDADALAAEWDAPQPAQRQDHELDYPRIAANAAGWHTHFTEIAHAEPTIAPAPKYADGTAVRETILTVGQRTGPEGALHRQGFEQRFKRPTAANDETITPPTPSPVWGGDPKVVELFARKIPSKRAPRGSLRGGTPDAKEK